MGNLLLAFSLEIIDAMGYITSQDLVLYILSKISVYELANRIVLPLYLFFIALGSLFYSSFLILISLRRISRVYRDLSRLSLAYILIIYGLLGSFVFSISTFSKLDPLGIRASQIPLLYKVFIYGTLGSIIYNIEYSLSIAKSAFSLGLYSIFALEFMVISHRLLYVTGIALIGYYSKELGIFIGHKNIGLKELLLGLRCPYCNDLAYVTYSAFIDVALILIGIGLPAGFIILALLLIVSVLLSRGSRPYMRVMIICGTLFTLSQTLLASSRTYLALSLLVILIVLIRLIATSLSPVVDENKIKSIAQEISKVLGENDSVDLLEFSAERSYALHLTLEAAYMIGLREGYIVKKGELFKA